MSSLNSLCMYIFWYLLLSSGFCSAYISLVMSWSGISKLHVREVVLSSVIELA